MTSEELRQSIPGYLAGRLTPAEKEAFEKHLLADPELRIEVAELQAIWEGLGRIPEEEPSPAVRARFYQRLHDISNGRARVSTGGFAWWKPGLSGLVRQAMVPLVLFALGLYVGRSGHSAAEPGRGSSQELAQLQGQVQDMRRTVALSLLDRQSVTSRLEGVSWTTRVDRLDPELLSALVQTLNHDANTNVRLSSLDALEKFADDANVRKALVDSLAQQNSPLVQIALIDALVHMHNRSAAGEFRKLSKDTDVNAAVQQRARWGLEKLTLN
jgi:HEAT repeats